MASESSRRGSINPTILTAGAAIASKEVWQLPDGRAGSKIGGAAASGDTNCSFDPDGVWVVTKATGVVLLPGGRVWWDHSANAATYRRVNDRDFYLGRCVGGAASADPTVAVAYNLDPRYDLDLCRDPFATAIVGTQALGGLGLYRRGGAHHFVLDATNEAQKVDALSVDGFAVGANAIVEFAFRVIDGSAGSAPDVSIGLANATHATDADSITESLFIHLNGNDVNIYAESDDGTTEVAATDTTLNLTVGATVSERVEVWFDLRDPTDIQLYVNGANVLPATVFKLNAATGPLKALVHVEKTAATDAAELAVDWFRVRYSEQ